MVYSIIFLNNKSNKGIIEGDRGYIKGGGKVRAGLAESECLGEGGGVNVAKGEGCTEVGELNGNCVSDTRAGASDDNNLV